MVLKLCNQHGRRNSVPLKVCNCLLQRRSHRCVCDCYWLRTLRFRPRYSGRHHRLQTNEGEGFAIDMSVAILPFFFCNVWPLMFEKLKCWRENPRYIVYTSSCLSFSLFINAVNDILIQIFNALNLIVYTNTR